MTAPLLETANHVQHELVVGCLVYTTGILHNMSLNRKQSIPDPYLKPNESALTQLSATGIPRRQQHY
jgi:hypothetical protein